MTSIARIAATALALGLVAPAAFAKAHDQGSTAEPGQNVQAETVEPAQRLGALLGNRPAGKGPKG